MGTVNVGIVGVGNCASSLVQGVAFYGAEGADPAGLPNPVCAGYSVADVRFTSAFDVNSEKIGRDLSEAIWAAPNNARRFADVPPLGVPVTEGFLGDGVGHTTAGRIDARGSAGVEEVAERLRATGTAVLVNFLPVGSPQATELYAEAALLAGCAFVNCMPSAVARSPRWAERFREAGLPLVGDDLKSQFGSTLVHHALLDTLARNGVLLRSTYQLNNGGNMDFLNMQDPERLRSKQATKAQGMAGGAEGGALPAAAVHVGAEYIPFLEDRKVAFIRLEGSAFGGTPLEIELRMTVDDSPSAAGNVLDAVRYSRLALEHGISGVFDPVSALLMKAAPRPMTEDAALAELRGLTVRSA
ncbi:inositol-3-phosphate synthase [Kitasatospora sp. NBC_00240]|uniref:inositol-3-phosphate synthase n=1 Tax=Kitasatospora sp. NBC_00240 TaxID=2903567 RepID=UPI00224D2F05|nr:inositol-3-phosphate synthase [Kitasatospora sp. NBC_00240]MCX5209851.1 inositol-3-phosphate synthase [Kitasatospora sp. NBC_00240]